MRHMDLSSFIRRVGAGTAATALVAAGAALASPQIKSAAYSGSLSGNRSSYLVTFKVSPTAEGSPRCTSAARPSSAPVEGRPLR